MSIFLMPLSFFIQMLIGILLHKIASIEEGKRYLNLNSKIIHDIKIALKKHHSFLNKETIENLNATLYLLDQHFVRHKSVPICGKNNNKGNEMKLSGMFPSNICLKLNPKVHKGVNTGVVKRAKIIPTYTI